MAEKKTASSAPKKGVPNDGFTVLQKTTVTVYQNSKGVKRVIRETTSAPKAKKQSAPKTPAKNGGKNGKKQ